ncbi:partial Putative HTH-type transcriptional regulator, partial [Anaerolineae bacterium]
LPDLQNFPSLDSLAQCESVQFFLERAATVRPDFKLTNQNARAISQVCHRLDGMPLAIELSAARVKLLTVEQIVARLDDRFRLLTGGNRTALPRQQTLRTAIDWSYDMLSTQEQGLFRCLSVFAGGFTIEAVETICSDDDLEAAQVLDVLTELVDKSMLIADTTGRAEARYRMLETIREYAHEKSNEVNETQLMRARHLEFYVKLAEEAEPKLKGPEAKDWMDRLEIEYDNIRAVFEYAMANDVESAVCLVWSLVMFWVRRGYLIEGRNVLTQLLARSELQGTTRLRLQALKAIGYLQVYLQDSVVVRTYFEEGLTIAKMLENESEIAFAMHGIGRAFIFLNDYPAARPFIEESLVIYRKIGNRWGEAQSLYSLGAVVWNLDDLTQAQRFLEESVVEFQSIGDICDSVWPLSTLALMAREQGNYARAIELYEKCIETDERVDDRIHIAMNHIGLGWTFLGQGNYRRAADIFTQGLEQLKRRGRPIMFVQWLIGTAGALRGLGKPPEAARLLGAADFLFDYFLAKGITNSAYRKLYARVSNDVRAELGAEAFAQLEQAGRAMDLDQAIEFALAELKISDSPNTRTSALSPRQAAKEKFDGLTTREREVAALIARGKSNREIAETLVLSERTIEGHVGNILNKLGFNARTQIAAWAVQKNMLDRAPSTR